MVNGGTVYYPFINKIAEQTDLTPANISEDVLKRRFSTRYEIKELSTSKKLSELFANLENEVGVQDTVCFSLKLMNEDEVLSTSKRLSDTFANLEDEVRAEDAVHFSARFMDEDEVPSEIKEQVINKNASSVPIEAVEMMKHLPQELCDNFE